MHFCGVFCFDSPYKLSFPPNRLSRRLGSSLFGVTLFTPTEPIRQVSELIRQANEFIRQASELIQQARVSLFGWK